MIIGLMRVKNEARWIERAVRSIMPLCAAVLVMDDHSTDATALLAANCGATVFRSPYHGLDEARDKNLLLQKALDLSRPTWALMIDGDEELEESGSAKIRALMSRPGPMAFSLPVRYLWDSPDQWRTDGVYGQFHRPSLWRLRRGQRFRSTGAAGNFHCGSVPYGLGAVRCDAALLHYGYMLREDRIRKYAWYRSIDGGNLSEDGYKHIVIGDVFPADSRFRHGGPLHIQPI